MGVSVSAIMEKKILEEIRSLRETLERIEILLEERLIGVEEPLPDEVRAIEEYEAEKKKGGMELVDLDEVLRGSEG